MSLLTLTLMLVNGLLLVSTLGIVYPLSILYAMGRVSLWATFFCYCGAVFGFLNYGKVMNTPPPTVFNLIQLERS